MVSTRTGTVSRLAYLSAFLHRRMGVGGLTGGSESGAGRASKTARLSEQRQGRRVSSSPVHLTSQWTPRVDIKEEPERFVIQADIPGVDPKDIEVHMEKGILVEAAERSRS